MAQAPFPVTATRALVLAHDPEAPAGWLGEWAQERGIDLVTVDATLGGLPPATDTADVVVVLGSFRSAYATDPPWIAEEAAWLRETVAAEVPVLGICFGAQALARALGGEVCRAAEPETGLLELDVAPGDHGVGAGPWPVFHYDTITAPPSSTVVARSDRHVHAFVQGPHLGVQFHPEVTPESLEEWAAIQRATDPGVADEVDRVA